MRASFLVLLVTVLAGVLLTVACGGGGQSGFCAKHACIPNFDNGSGYIVQCNDGMWSHSGGEPGACAYHGGER